MVTQFVYATTAISLPSRIISCNDNTYEVRLSDGTLRNNIKRSDLWLEPTIELKLSALAVDFCKKMRNCMTRRETLILFINRTIVTFNRHLRLDENCQPVDQRNQEIYLHWVKL